MKSFVLLLVAGGVVGCGGTTTSNGPGDGAINGTVDLAMGGGLPDLAAAGGGDMAVAPPVTLTGKVYSGGGNNNPPVMGATVTLVGTSTKATTAADGSYSLMVPGGAIVYLNVAAATFQTTEVGQVVPQGGGAAEDIQVVPTANVQMVVGMLNPPLTLDPAKGVVVVNFKTSDTNGGYGVTLSASHGNSFDPNGSTYTNTTLGGHMGGSLVFPNVVAGGTTTLTLAAPQGKTCSLTQAIKDWRVDANVFLFVSAACQ